MSFLLTKLRGVYRVLSGAVPLPDVPAINFGAGLSAVYNAVAQRIDVTVAELVESLHVVGLEVDEEALFDEGLHADGPIVATDGVQANEVTLSGDVEETRVLLWAPLLDSNTDWEFSSDGVVKNNAANKSFGIPLDLPHGVRLKTIAVGYMGKNGHSAFPAGMPDPMPYVDVRYVDIASGPNSILDASDTSATAGAYEAEHEIVVSGMTHIVDRLSHRYHAQFTSEGASHFLAGGQVLYVKATWDRLAGSKLGQD
jgi:hypothetical protein